MALNGDEEDFEWEPPTEAEMKVIQARRERQDRISKLMGDYLLKGYRMLGDSCEACGTVLLQDRQQKNYCVSCQELDSDIDKDNPALNPQAALSQVRERQLAAQVPAAAPELNGGPTSSQAGVSVPQPRPEHCEGAAAGGRALLPPPAVASPPPPASTTATLAPIRPPVCPQNSTLRPVLEEAEEAVLTKLRWATTQLQSSASLEASIQLCGLIGSCANSLRSLKELSQWVFVSSTCLCSASCGLSTRSSRNPRAKPPSPLITDTLRMKRRRRMKKKKNEDKAQNSPQLSPRNSFHFH